LVFETKVEKNQFYFFNIFLHFVAHPITDAEETSELSFQFELFSAR